MIDIKYFWKRLWNEHTNSDSIFDQIGFSKYYEVPKNSKLWQSTHMFDFVVKK
ncbi:hypothetical protein ES708_31458 [subsurface metagenome]